MSILSILEAHGELLIDVLHSASLLIFGFAIGVYSFGTQLAARVECAMIRGEPIGPVCGLMQSYDSSITLLLTASTACIVAAMGVRGYTTNSGIFSRAGVATCNNDME